MRDEEEGGFFTDLVNWHSLLNLSMEWEENIWCTILFFFSPSRSEIQSIHCRVEGFC